MKPLLLLKKAKSSPLNIFILICFLLMPTMLSATKIKYKASDGFVWTCITNKDKTCEAKDQKGKIIIPSSRGYTWIFYKHGMFEVRRGTKFGVCDSSGKEIISPDTDYDMVSKQEGDIISLYRKGVAGASDLSGKIIIPFDRCYEGVYGHKDFVKVIRDGKEGACNMNGEEVVPPVYKEVYCIDGVFKYKDTDGSLKTVPTTSSGSPSVSLPESKQLKTEEDGFQWYLTTDAIGCRGAQDQDGKDIVPLSARWKSVVYDGGYFIGAYINKEGRYYDCCIYDQEGNVIIGKNRYVNASFVSFKGSGVKYFVVEKNGKKGACDITGREIVAPQYEDLYYTEDQGFTYIVFQNNQVSHFATNIFLPGLEKEVLKKSAVIQKAWLEQGAEIDGREALKVNCDFSVEGLRNQTGHVEVWIKNSKGKWHTFYGNATSADGISYKSIQFVPPYDSAVYDDFWLCIYNADLKLSGGTNKYEAIIRITDNDGNILAENPPIAFTETAARQVTNNFTPYTPTQNTPSATLKDPKKGIATAQASQVKDADSNKGINKKTSGEILKEQLKKKNERMARSYVPTKTYNELYKDYERKLKDMYEGYRTYNDRSRRNYQDEMREIRQECNERGIKLFGGQSKWETWDGKCK